MRRLRPASSPIADLSVRDGGIDAHRQPRLHVRGVDDGADALGLDSIGKDSLHSENRPTPPKEEKSVESSPC